jgi:TRAP-type C4-dicarboxylate transport system permease small subunit
VATGLAIALFMPWCQLQRGNIIVDFFTAHASPRTTHWLDRMGSFSLAGVMALLAWRTAMGGLNAWANHSGSMLLGFPDWVVYGGMVPPLALTALIALWQTAQGQPKGEPS